MKTIKTLAVIFILFTAITSLHADDKIKIKIKQPPPNMLGVGDMWNLTLENTTKSDLKIYLTGTATEEKDGLIIEGKSKVFTIKPGRSTYKYNDFSGAEVKYNNGKYKEIILRTGNAPEGSYTICVTAFDESGNEVGRENCIMQSVIIGIPTEIFLLHPCDLMRIDCNEPLIFTWTPMPKPEKYTFRLYETGKEDEVVDDEYIFRKKAIFEENDISGASFKLPTSIKLEEGKRYAWSISVRDFRSRLCWFYWCLPKKPKNICKELKVDLKKVTSEKDTSCCYSLSITNSYKVMNESYPFSFTATINSGLITSASSAPTGFTQTPATIPPNIRSVTWTTSNGIKNERIDLSSICILQRSNPAYLVYEWKNKKGEVVCKDSIKLECKTDSVRTSCCVYKLQIYNFISPVTYNKIRVVGENNSNIIAANGDEWSQQFSQNAVIWTPEDLPEDIDELESEIGAGGEIEPIDNEFFVKLDPNISGTNQEFRVEFLNESNNIVYTQRISIPCLYVDFEDENTASTDWTQYTVFNSSPTQVLAVAVPWECNEFEAMASYDRSATTCEPTVNITCTGNNQYSVTLTSAIQDKYNWTYTDNTGMLQTASTQSISFVVPYGYTNSANLTVSEQVITEISTPAPNPNDPPIITYETTYVEVCTSTTEIDLNFGSIDFTYEMKDCNPLELTFKATGIDADNISSYQWTNITSNASFVTNLRESDHTLAQYSVLYNIKLKVTDKYGCTHEVSKDIKIEPFCNPQFTYVYDWCKQTTNNGVNFYTPPTATVHFENISEGGDCNAIYKWYVNNTLFHTGPRGSLPPPQNFNVTEGSMKTIKLIMVSSMCTNGQQEFTQIITFNACFYDFTIEKCGDETVVFKTDLNNPEPVWNFPGHRIIHDYILYNHSSTHIKKHQYDNGPYSATMTIINPVTRCRCIVTKNFIVQQQFCCEKKEKQKGVEIISIDGKNYRWKWKFKIKGHKNKIKAKSNFTRVLFNTTFGINIYWFGASKRVVSNTIDVSGILRSELEDGCPCNVPHNWSDNKVNNPLKVRTKIKQKPALLVNAVETDWKVKSGELTATYTLVLKDRNNNPVSTTPKTIVFINQCP